MGVVEVQNKVRIGDVFLTGLADPDEFKAPSSRKNPVAQLAPDIAVMRHFLPPPSSFSFSSGRGFHARYPWKSRIPALRIR